MIFIGIKWGIIPMIVGMIGSSIMSYYLNSYWSGKMIGYSISNQLKDLWPSFAIAALMGIVVYTEGLILNLNSFLVLGIQMVSGIVIVISICELINFKDYFWIKNVIFEKLRQLRK